jgi:nucleoside 2-deoxyribosyltransferase
MKKKIYISLPIAFQENTVYERNEKGKSYVNENYPEYETISPIDVNKLNDEVLANHLELEKTAYYMGQDIEQVILCDAILMCPGWENSKGCKVEKFTAETYGKEILYIKE